MKRKILASVIIVVSIAVVATFLYLQANRPIKVGVAFNMSGDYSYMGISENRILHFLINNYFKNLPVQLKSLDDKSSDNGIKQAINTLNKWGAQVIIGGAISKVGVPASIYATKEKIPFLGTSSTSSKIFGKKDYYFTSDYSNSIISKATGIMIEKAKSKRTLIVCSNANKSYSVELAGYIKNYVKSCSVLTINSDDLQRQIIDRIVSEIKNKNFDSILFTIDSRTTAILAQKIKKEFPQIKLFGTGWNSDSNLIKFGGKSIEGFESVSTYPKIPNPLMSKIEKDYYSTYNDNISDFFVFIYNDLVMLKEAIGNGCRTKKEIYNYFSTPRYYNGVDGKFFINEFGDAQRNYIYLLYVNNGNWKQSKLVLNNINN